VPAATLSGWASEPSISADGRLVAYTGHQSDQPGSVGQIYLRDIAAATTTLISATPMGLPADAVSMQPSISGDGRFVAFLSLADDLVPGANNHTYNVYVRDVRNGTTALASVSSTGQLADDFSWHPSLSADGHRVVFESLASTLDPTGTGGSVEAYLRDLTASTTMLVSVGQDGRPAKSRAENPKISADGRHVVFDTAAVLSPSDVNDWEDIYERDLDAGVTRLVSSGGPQFSPDQSPSVSGDGRFVVYQHAERTTYAEAQQMIDDLECSGTCQSYYTDTTGVVMTDMGTGVTTRVPPPIVRVPWIDGISSSVISADGTVVAYATLAPSEVGPDAAAPGGVYVWNRITGELNEASVDSLGIAALGPSFLPTLSGDGRFVAFASDAKNLAAGDPVPHLDVYRRDRSAP